MGVEEIVVLVRCLIQSLSMCKSFGICLVWLSMTFFCCQPGNPVQRSKTTKRVEMVLIFSALEMDRRRIMLHERPLSLSSHCKAHTKPFYKWAMATEALMKFSAFCSAADTRATALGSCSVYTVWSTRACGGWCNTHTHRPNVSAKTPFPLPQPPSLSSLPLT